MQLVTITNFKHTKSIYIELTRSYVLASLRVVMHAQCLKCVTHKGGYLVTVFPENDKTYAS